MLDKFIDSFAAVVAARAQKIIPRSAPTKDARHSGRLCSYPGCKNPGNGPRFRWFCVDHAASVPVSEQKRILAERAKKAGASLSLKGKRRRGSALKGKKLDMRCRVAGCKNVSKGPRFGFICAEHLKKLSVRELNAAREKWKAAHAKKAA
jgi:hypothetical protein